MRYKDPKTGVTCLTIRTAILRFCGHNPCTDCPLFCFKNHGCWNWAENHPTEAAHLMGYEVIEDSSSDSSTEINESPTDTPITLDDIPTGSGDTPTDKDINVLGKPHLAEVLGVEVGEEFTFPYPNRAYDRVFVDSEGILHERDSASGNVHRIGSRAVCWLINHLESIIRTPRLTEPEIAIMRDCGAKWVSRDKGEKYVRLWSKRPCCLNDSIFINNSTEHVAIGNLTGGLFPSVHPGDCIELEDAQ